MPALRRGLRLATAAAASALRAAPRRPPAAARGRRPAASCTSETQGELAPLAPALSGATAHAQRVHTVDNFLTNGLAERLRARFADAHADPASLAAERFVWDYWHAPGQYRQLRTPAQDYFEAGGLWGELESALLRYGREELGCSALTPPWLSVYVSGMRQQWHSDARHGPWAFVLSLTDWEARRFSGGETQLLTDGALGYWDARSGASDGVAEMPQLIQQVEPLFNRLTVFDPRVPHCVAEVQGEMDPAKGRLVVHGWFAESVPRFEGGIGEGTERQAAAEEIINERLGELFTNLATLPACTGTLVVRLAIAADGSVSDAAVLTDTLQARPCGLDPLAVRAEVLAEVGDALGTLRFDPAASAGGESAIVLPLVFE